MGIMSFMHFRWDPRRLQKYRHTPDRTRAVLRRVRYLRILFKETRGLPWVATPSFVVDGVSLLSGTQPRSYDSS